MVSKNQHKKYIFVFIFLVLLGLAIYLLKDYLLALSVGALFAYFLYPLYNKLSEKLKSKRLAGATLSLGSITIVVVLLFLIILPLVSQTQLLYEKSEQYITSQISELKNCQNETTSNFECEIGNTLVALLGGEELKEKVTDIAKTTSLFFAESITRIIDSIVSFIIFISIVLFSIFYFLDNGKEIKDTIVELLPLKTDHKMRIIERLEETINAVVVGNVSTALLQGVAGCIIFFILGIGSSMFWGLLMAVFAFIPAVGPAIIWIPAVIILFIKGSFIKATILLIYCIAVLGYIDNVLKPKLISDKIKLSPFIIFLGVMGGLQVFGILGIIFGPLILALLSTFIQIYREEMI